MHARVRTNIGSTDLIDHAPRLSDTSVLISKGNPSLLPAVKRNLLMLQVIYIRWSLIITYEVHGLLHIPISIITLLLPSANTKTEPSVANHWLGNNIVCRLLPINPL